MEQEEFRQHAHRLVDWMADYFESIRALPVKSPAEPGDILDQLPVTAPTDGEPFDRIMGDFESIIMPGITHWQHPSFFAYFPANNSPPSLLGEMLTATLGAQCMSWQTSPAAAELEERVMQWLRKMIGLPESFTGVIQDTASTATLCSILTAREQVSNYEINRRGFSGNPAYAVYCSEETHSSIEKAVRIAGIGADNLRKVGVDSDFALRPQALRETITKDRDEGIVPLCVVATLGTTGSTAIDPLAEIGAICRDLGVWLHVDAAYAGAALLLPEMRRISDGVELADTFVFNPHKWMFTNFDCSAYFVKDKVALVRTFEILPEYLKTSEDARVNNYRDWGIQLGRRFRALKLWFVIRSYGVNGLREKVREHIALAQRLAGWIERTEDFELLAPGPLNLICFRYKPSGVTNLETLNSLNESLLNEVNSTGKLYLTHTKLAGAYAIRMAVGQTRVNKDDVEEAWRIIQDTARRTPGGR
jgi:aromatic-L-amino-acid decarboxylase